MSIASPTRAWICGPCSPPCREWGDRWAAPDGAPLAEPVHDVCGEVMFLTHTCRLACGGAVRPPLGARTARARRLA